MNRTLIWQLAIRYLRGKRSANAVPILSRISMIAITVCSAAMVIVLSVFNGLDYLVKDMYKAFYPDVKISVARGKFFPAAAIDLNKLRNIAGVKDIATVIEDQVLVTAENDFSEKNEQQLIVTLKGIDNNYLTVNNLKKYIRGQDSVTAIDDQTAIVGKHNMNAMGIDIDNIISKIALYYPNTTLKNPDADPDNAFQVLKLHPTGCFHIEDDFDSKYILAPISLAQKLFRQEGMYSSIELSITRGYDDKVKEKLQQLLGDRYKIETRYEQNKTLYMVMVGEKWAIYFILLLVMIIASFNMVGALGMLVLEKRKDIAMLKAMGADQPTIQKVFMLEGMLWSLIGGLSGILLGCIICFLQQKFSLIKMRGDFLVDAYPVKIALGDLLLVVATIITVGLFAAWYPATRATATTDPSLKSA